MVECFSGLLNFAGEIVDRAVCGDCGDCEVEGERVEKEDEVDCDAGDDFRRVAAYSREAKVVPADWRVLNGLRAWSFGEFRMRLRMVSRIDWRRVSDWFV